MEAGLRLVTTLALIAFVTGEVAVLGNERGPEFLMPLDNITTTQGRDVYFTCFVNNLGPYKVAWIKSDTKTILAIHTHMVTLNPRLSVSHNNFNTWRLYINNVKSKDSGTYMCQVNTDPMTSQMGHLSVVVPPDIVDERGGPPATLEGGSVELHCHATGEPQPVVSWRRDAPAKIVIRDEVGTEVKSVDTYAGNTLRLLSTRRSDMGAYHCVASNGVPPSVTKRYDVILLFHPVVRVAKKVTAAPIQANVTLQCYVEASPKSLNTWIRSSGSKIISGAKYKMTEVILNKYSVQMLLIITDLVKTDFGEYMCTASNAYGRNESVVRLQEMHLPPKITTSTTTTKSSTTSTSTTTRAPEPRVITKPPSRKTKQKHEDHVRLASNVISSEDSDKNKTKFDDRTDKVRVRPSDPPEWQYNKSYMLKTEDMKNLYQAMVLVLMLLC